MLERSEKRCIIIAGPLAIGLALSYLLTPNLFMPYSRYGTYSIWAIGGFLTFLIYLAMLRKRFLPHAELVGRCSVFAVGPIRFFLYFFVPLVNVVWMIIVTRAAAYGFCLWHERQFGGHDVGLDKLRSSIFKKCGLLSVLILLSLVYLLATSSVAEPFEILPLIPYFISLALSAALYFAFYLNKPIHSALCQEYFCIFFQALMVTSIVYLACSSRAVLAYATGIPFWAMAISLSGLTEPMDAIAENNADA